MFLSPDFAKRRPYVIRIRIKWLTERFYTDTFTDENPGTDTDDKIAPTLFNVNSIFFWIRNADTDTDTETWNRGIKYTYFA